MENTPLRKIVQLRLGEFFSLTFINRIKVTTYTDLIYLCDAFIAETIDISSEISNAHSFSIYVILRARVLPRFLNHTQV